MLPSNKTVKFKILHRRIILPACGFLVLLIAVSFTLCTVKKPVPKNSTPTERENILYHKVKSGDTLAKIATMYGTTWQELFKFNRDRVSNPHLIFEGEIITIKQKRSTVQGIKTSVVKGRLIKHMFSVSGLEFREQSYLVKELERIKNELIENGASNLDTQRQLSLKLITTSRQLEIYNLLEAIFLVASNERDYRLIANLYSLAWQESHFVNRVGGCGEVSFYQFLPSTVKKRGNLTPDSLQNILSLLKNSPLEAVKYAKGMLTEHKTIKAALNAYNHNPDYSDQVTRKYTIVMDMIKSCSHGR